MKRSELTKGIKEKLLLTGPSGAGKSYISIRITKIYLMNGKKVLYIDPEGGIDRELEKVLGDLTDTQLDKFELVRATNIETYLKYMLGWEKEETIGSQVIKTVHGVDYDLKVCDGIGVEIEQYMTHLTTKFLKQGYYESGGKHTKITDPDTFLLPWEIYPKVYAQIKQALVVMLDHEYDVLCTTHGFKDTDSQKSLEQSIFAKFDSVVRVNKLSDPISGFPRWNATIIKNRGRESIENSNILENIEPLLAYFATKFNMDVNETLERLK